MRALGVSRLYVLGDISDPFDADIAELIANDAPPAITVVGQSAVRHRDQHGAAGLRRDRRDDRGRRAPTPSSWAGGPGPGALALWSELHAVLPHAKLFAPSTLATPAFLAGLGERGERDLRDQPDPELRQYPRAGRRVLAAYRRRFGLAPTAVRALRLRGDADWCSRAIERAHSRSRAAVRFGASSTSPRCTGRSATTGSTATATRSLDALDGYPVSAAGQLVFRQRIPAG